MQYNYSFEAASLLFMLLIFVHFMVVWQFPTEKTRVFRALLIVCIGESAFNILSSIGLANAGVVPQIVNEILAFVFFSFEGLSSLMIYKYMVVISELDQRQKKRAVSEGRTDAGSGRNDHYYQNPPVSADGNAVWGRKLQYAHGGAGTVFFPSGW